MEIIGVLKGECAVWRDSYSIKSEKACASNEREDHIRSNKIIKPKSTEILFIV